MISIHFMLIAQGLIQNDKLNTSIPIGIFVIVGIIVLLVTLAFILSPRGSRRRGGRNAIFRK